VEKLTDSEYLELQTALILQPELGDVIPDTGGLRKLRWKESRRGKGKRGGVRVIYYWYASGSLIYLLHIYSKSEQEDLSADEKRILRRLVSKELK
jgi:mRNA-degrading endonuclease RelE of RelBE toxin-antitoxin system